MIANITKITTIELIIQKNITTSTFIYLTSDSMYYSVLAVITLI